MEQNQMKVLLCIISFIMITPGFSQADLFNASVISENDTLWAVLENENLLVKYKSENPAAMSVFQIKNHDVNIAGGTRWKRLDDSAKRGKMTDASVTVDSDTIKTILIKYGDNAASAISIFPHDSFIRITYINGWINIFDWCYLRDDTAGTHVVYNGEEWAQQRGWAIPYPDIWDTDILGEHGYYWRMQDDNWQTISYKGYFIGGVFHASTGIGYGRVMPLEHVQRAIKLMPNCGFELFPPYEYREIKDGSKSFDGYIFAVTEGERDVLKTGKAIVDMHLKGK
jgi:hypothetical protein